MRAGGFGAPAAGCMLVLWMQAVHRAAGFQPGAPPLGWKRAAVSGAYSGLRGDPLRARRQFAGRPMVMPSASAGRGVSMHAFGGGGLNFGSQFAAGQDAAAQRPVQTVDFTTLRAVSAELQCRLPLRVAAVTQAGETDISVALQAPSSFVDEDEAERRLGSPSDMGPGETADAESAEGGEGSNVWMTLSWHKKFGRMSFSSTAPLRSSDSAFSRVVDDKLSGLYLIRVRPLPFSRILRLGILADE